MTNDDVAKLVREIEAKDACTAAHTWRVVLYSRAMAEASDLSEDLIGRITHAAALHDIGKLDVPDEILRKPGALSAAEFEIIKSHAELGHARLLSMGVTDPVILGFVRHHHERVDGRGYPDGLLGEDIPWGARVFAVIDAFDAMTGLRPYRSDVGEREAHRAITILQKEAGSAFCPQSVAMFSDLFHTGQLEWILNYFNDTESLPQYAGEPEPEVVVTVKRVREPL